MHGETVSAEAGLGEGGLVLLVRVDVVVLAESGEELGRQLQVPW